MIFTFLLTKFPLSSEKKWQISICLVQGISFLMKYMDKLKNVGKFYCAEISRNLFYTAEIVTVTFRFVLEFSGVWQK